MGDSNMEGEREVECRDLACWLTVAGLTEVWESVQGAFLSPLPLCIQLAIVEQSQQSAMLVCQQNQQLKTE